MSENLIPTHAVLQFTSNLELLLQEQGAKLRPFVDVKSGYVGKAASPVNQFGSVAMKKVTSRFTPKTPANADTKRRWVSPEDFSLDQPLDPFDLQKTLEDPKGIYATNAGYAAGRQMDLSIITAAFAVAKVGEQDDSSTESFDTAFSIAATFGVGGGGENGMSVDKLIEGRRLLGLANVDLDMEEPTVVIGPTQEADLLRQVQVTSADYSKSMVLDNGRVRRFLGNNFRISNQLALESTDNRACIMFVKSGMHLGIWQEIANDAHQRFDLEANPWELTTTMSVGATRLQNGKVVRIYADE